MSRSKSNSKNMGKNMVRPYTVMCTDMYVLLILIVFPLYYADGYFHLPEKKAMFWTVSTLVYVIVCLVGVVITAFSMRENWNMENFKKNITMTDVFMFGFLLSNLIALAMSNDVMGSWVGQNARYYGARVLILVCVAYFLVSRYAWINQVFIVAFLIGGNGVCLLATFDYFGMDVLGINKQMQPNDWLMFISTMGNANTCASYVTMAVAGALCYYCVAREIKAKVFAGISIVNCSMALITARSDSAFVGIAVIIIVLGVLTIIKKIDIQNFIMALTLLILGILCLGKFRALFASYLLDQTYDSGIPAILIEQQVFLFIVFAVLILAYIGLHYMNAHNIKFSKKITRVIIVVVTAIVLIIGTVVTYKFNIIELFKIGIGVSGIEITGNRAFIYKRTLQCYGKLPLINKIFGSGQASLYMVMNQYFGEDLAYRGISINSAHNHILDYLINTGIVGVICYIGSMICFIKHSFKALSQNTYVVFIIGCVISYLAQGFFNIDQTNTTTIFWLMFALGEAVFRQNIIKKEENETI